MDWRLFWLKATLKHFIPFKPQLRALKRRFRPYRTDPVMDHGLLASGLHLLQVLERHGVPCRDAAVLELGSGWNPVIPLLFVLAGARRVVMTDIERLMDGALLRAALRSVLSSREEIAAGLNVASDRLEADRLGRALAALDGGARFEAALEALGMAYLVPFDPAAVPAGSVDISLSRATLEHIPLADLRAIFRQFRRLARPGGVTIHETDHSDHRSHYDPSVSPVDFLRYSPAAWRLIDLRRRHNRLRCSELAALIEQAGWRILAVETETTEAAARAIRALRLAAVYRTFALEDLAVQSSVILARNPAPPA